MAGAKVLKLDLVTKPTVRNLNSALLKFHQGSDILEKEIQNPELDNKQVKKNIRLSNCVLVIPRMKQVLKLVYKDVFGIVKSMLKDPKFGKHLKFEGEVERYFYLIQQ